jgi:hypothetical protein
MVMHFDSKVVLATGASGGLIPIYGRA